MGNLVFWIALAVIVAVLVSDRVDLGLETSLRSYQATAIAHWSPIESRSAGAMDQPAEGSEAPQPLQTAALARQPTPVPGEVNGEDSPAIPWVEKSAQEELSQTEAGSPSVQATLLPSETLSRSSLLITNPKLEALDVQLNRVTGGHQVKIHYEETALNQEIIALLENHPDLPYRLSWIDLKPGGIVLTGSSRVWGLPISIRVEGTLTAERCRPKVDIRSVYIAKVSAPRFAQEWVTARILETMAWFPTDYPFCLQEIWLEEGRLVLVGVRR